MFGGVLGRLERPSLVFRRVSLTLASPWLELYAALASVERI